MKKDRLVGFFDGVIAIIMTVLVLELPKKVRHWQLFGKIECFILHI